MRSEVRFPTGLICLFAAIVMVAASSSSRAALSLPGVSGSTPLVMQLDPNNGVSTDGSGNVISWTDTTGTGDGVGGAFSPTATGSAVKLVSNVTKDGPVVRFNNGYLQTAFTTTNANISSSNNAFSMFVVTHGATNPLGLFDTNPNLAGAFRFYPSNNIDDAGWPAVNVTLDSTITVLGITMTSDVANNRLIWVVREVDSNSMTTNLDQTNAPGTGRGTAWQKPVVGAINLGTAGNYNADVAQMLVYQGALSATDFAAVQTALVQEFIPEPTSLGIAVLGAGSTLLSRGAHRKVASVIGE